MTIRILLSLLLLSTAAAAGCGDDDRPATGDAGGGDADVEPDAGPPGCPTGTTMCGEACVDTQSSRTHCGGCDFACGAGEACVDGVCDVLCPEGQSECDGACVNTMTDRLHCGGCGTPCASGEICVDGACEISCPAGQTLCGTTCVDTASDPGHCGACDAACGAGEVCSESACATACGAGLMDCGGACVDTQNSPLHCGACDAACPAPAGGAGLCMAGSCRAICDPLTADCNADIGSASGDGCETSTATDVSNCGACGRVCTLANAVAGCAAGGCVIASCDAGWADCDSDPSNGCEVNVTDDDMNCGACGTICTAGSERCFASSCTAVVGDTCSTAIALAPGSNSVTWSAFGQDYLTSAPSCGSGYAPTGPDIVLTYTATVDERIQLTFNKPEDTRWHAVASTAACGTLTPELVCISDWAPPTMSGDFILLAGETAYIYVVDSTSGTGPLDNPVSIDLAATACTAAPAVTVDPPNGSTTISLSPTFTATFAAPVVTTLGTVTITGNMGTSISYDLSTSPSQVTFGAANTVMTIDPGIAFPAGERLTLSWTGVQAVVCTAPVPVPAPTWVVDIITPPCAPGVGGVVGTTVTRIPTGLSTTPTEFFVVPDESATGYVYLGGTADVYRIPKAGGTAENVETAASLTTAHEGYDMLVDGNDVYTLESTTTGTSGHFWRISTTGGASWSIEDYASFPATPEDNFQTAVLYSGRIYLLTNEFTDTNPTQIWSVPAGSTTVPTTAVLETSFTAEEECAGMAMDNTYYYIACWQDDRLIRVDRTTGARTLLTDQWDIQISGNKVHAADLDADGTADVLYLNLGYEQIEMVCEPDSATPYFDQLVSWGTGSSNYGLGYDRTANVLWGYDDDTRELIRIQ